MDGEKPIDRIDRGGMSGQVGGWRRNRDIYRTREDRTGDIPAKPKRARCAGATREPGPTDGEIVPDAAEILKISQKSREYTPFIHEPISAVHAAAVYFRESFPYTRTSPTLARRTPPHTPRDVTPPPFARHEYAPRHHYAPAEPRR